MYYMNASSTLNGVLIQPEGLCHEMDYKYFDQKIVSPRSK